MQLLQSIFNNLYFQMINTLFGIIGIIIFTKYLIRKNNKQLCFFLKPTKLFSNIDIKEIKNTYMNIPINSITETEMIIWNKGKDILQGNDFVKKIEFWGESDCKLLDINFVTKKLEDNIFNYSLVDNHLIIDFDYLKIKQGIKLRIIHTGDIKDLNYKIESNSVKSSIEKSNYTADFISKKSNYNLLPIIYLVITIILTIIPVKTLFDIIKYLISGKNIKEISTTISSFISMLLSFSFIFYPKSISSIRKEFRINVPKEIR